MQTLRRTNLIRKRGNKFVNVSAANALKDVEIIGFYFGAHWCLPCRRFTPLLAKCYDVLKDKDEPFEIVFVSEDHDDDEMKQHMLHNHADWLAINVDREDHLGEKLRDWFGVEGIPALVIIRRNGYVITTEGKMDVQLRKVEAFYSWLDGSGMTLSPQTFSQVTVGEKSCNKCQSCLCC